MEFSRFNNFLVASTVLAVFIAGVSFASNTDNFFIPAQPASVANAQNNNQIIPSVPLPPPPPKKLANPPEIIKAVYVTGWSAGSKSYLKYLTNLFKTTEINAVVVDIKDYSGLVSYASDAKEVKKYNLYNNAIPDINALVRFFHDQNVYVIGRIAVFEDPGYSKARPDLAVYDKTKTTDKTKPVLWLDNHKLSWLDPASEEVWNYNVSLAKDVLAHGFDEINFDYIRFPSDGKTINMGFPVWDQKTERRVVLKNFFTYLRQALPDDKLSADLFGQATVNSDDLGIGQVLEDSLEFFDYVCPMVYPSHYATNFIGFENPADYPYEVVSYSMAKALKKEIAYKNLLENPTINLAKLRPWLQDFNMGAIYTAEMVKLQITASEDGLKNEYNGYMLWSPTNIYKIGAVLKSTPK